MLRMRPISMVEPAGGCSQWFPTTLPEAGKDEQFLEDELVRVPELLGLESRRTGIRGPFCVFRQVTLPTPAGRTIFPDIVLLAASGHVIVVEVKLGSNPELGRRDVIAQIVDYASSFAALSEQQLLDTLRVAGGATDSWGGFINAMFPSELDREELADLLLHRFKTGELNLVVACDRAPIGVRETVAGITSQASLGFTLDLVEITPYVCEASAPGRILLVPATRLATEIVARTAITVDFTSEVRPAVSVRTTSLEDIESNIREVKQAADGYKVWEPGEVEAAARESGSSAVVELLEFAKAHSDNGEFCNAQMTKNPNIGFYLSGQSSGGRVKKLVVWSHTLGYRPLMLYVDNVQQISKPDLVMEFTRRLKLLFGDAIIRPKQWSVPLSVVGEKMHEFKELTLWLKRAMVKE